MKKKKSDLLQIELRFKQEIGSFLNSSNIATFADCLEAASSGRLSKHTVVRLVSCLYLLYLSLLKVALHVQAYAAPKHT
jgi:hypothetical protein